MGARRGTSSFPARTSHDADRITVLPAPLPPGPFALQLIWPWLLGRLVRCVDGAGSVWHRQPSRLILK